jgi:hypothetical protein
VDEQADHLPGFFAGARSILCPEWEATRFWQTDQYLLGLKEPASGQLSDYTNDLVKNSAEDLFEYFLTTVSGSKTLSSRAATATQRRI